MALLQVRQFSSSVAVVVSVPLRTSFRHRWGQCTIHLCGVESAAERLAQETGATAVFTDSAAETLLLMSFVRAAHWISWW